MIVFFLILVSTNTVLSNGISALDREKWISAVTKFSHLAHPHKQQFISHLDAILNDTDIVIAEDCRQELFNFSLGLQKNQIVATVMFDSFSKVKPGMLTYQGYNFGAYDQCLDYGRYVYAGIDFPLPEDPMINKFESKADDWRIAFSKSMGIRRIHPFPVTLCLPDNCHDEDISAVFNSNYARQLMEPIKMRILTTESRSDPFASSRRQITAFILLFAIISLSIGSAVLNFLSPESSLAMKVKSFDAYENTMQLFSLPKQPDSMMTTFNIYRMTYVFAAIMNHVIPGVHMGTEAHRTEENVTKLSVSSPPFITILQILYRSSNTFLIAPIVISACFSTLKWMPDLMSGRKVSFLRFVAERILRTLPVTAAYLLVVQLLPILKHGGPIAKHVQEDYASVCWNNGWKELLYVNNFSDLRKTCLPIAWAMSVDVQLYLSSFFVMTLIAKYPKKAVTILCVQMGIGIIGSGIHFYVTGITPALAIEFSELYHVITSWPERSYHTVHYISAYAIGMLLGLKLLLVRVTARQPSLLLMASVAVVFDVVAIAQWFLYQSDGRTFLLSAGAELVFASIIRTLCAGAFATFCWCLFNQTHERILRIARSRFVTVVTRLSLSWFLVHVLFIVLTIASYENTGRGVLSLIMEYVFIILTSFLSACLLYVFVEAPFARLLSNHFKTRDARAKKVK